MCDPWAGETAGAGTAEPLGPLSPFLCHLRTWTFWHRDPKVAGFASRVEVIASYSVGRGNYDVPPMFKGRGQQALVLREGVWT